jgi:hypothetical protein
MAVYGYELVQDELPKKWKYWGKAKLRVYKILEWERNRALKY